MKDIVEIDLHAFVTNTRWDDLPDAVRHQAKRCLLDLIGVAAAGTTTELSRIIRNHAVTQFGGQGARLLFDGRRTSPAGAALAGGMTIDSIDAHDGHPMTKGHAGCGLLPALIAMIEDQALLIDGAEFLTTLVIGYEVAIAAGISLHATAPDYHTSGAWVGLGIAAMAARLFKFDATQMAEAMGIAEYHGPRSQMMRVIDAPTMLKDGSGWGAMAGVSAAYLARDGFTGAPAISAIAPEVAAHWQGLGQNWYCLEQYFKPFPVCRWAQPPVEAMVQIQRDEGFAATDIAAVNVVTFHNAARLNCGLPENTEQAQYNLPFSVAAYVLRGGLGVAEVGPDGFEDPEIRALASRITMSENDDYNRVYPGFRWAHVEVTLIDGRVLKSEPTIGIGNVENPLTDDFLNTKFAGFLSDAGFGTRSSTLQAVLWDFDKAPNTNALFDLVLNGV